VSEPRLDPSQFEQRVDSPWWSVHSARYRFALDYVNGKRVLDIACGTGYGMAMMLESAAGVIGIDIDLDSAKKAKLASKTQRSGVAVADGCALPFADGSFDVVTSFETVEHLDARPQFLAELRRVLKSNGVLVLSTPNAHYTLPVAGKPRNPYHVHEYTPQELQKELSTYFGQMDLLGQDLTPRFQISPFWDDQERMPKTLRARMRRLIWRVLYRLPGKMADILSNALWGHKFLPTPEDFVFQREIVNQAPVTVAICRRPV
jgi:SAM-dependent methyltransferase